MRPGFVGIPGRIVSTGGGVERVLARLIDDAETSFLHAADTQHPGPWAAALAYGNGILHGAAVLAQLRDDQVDGLFTMRCGALPAELYGRQP